MINIISICGTRPEVIRVIRDLPNHIIVNTGQHYDDNMDAVFWKERGFEPDVNLGAKTFPEMYERIDELLKKEKPKLVIIYGDTRSSFVGAMAAKDNRVKIAHLEAGVRGYDLDVPEERYRIGIDHISDYLFAINEFCKENLIRENVQGKIFVVGDILYDVFLEKRKHKGYVLMTIHREENQNAGTLRELLKEYQNEHIVFPAHPVIRPLLDKIKTRGRIAIGEPLGHDEMLELIKNAKMVITDSGGILREAFFAGVPLRVIMKKNPLEREISVFGDGTAREKIKKIIIKELYGK